MKKLLFTVLFLSFTAIGFSQTIKGNTVTSKEQAPIWPGCEDSNNAANCFNKMLAKHIQENYKFPKEYTKEDKGMRVIVSFIINKEGKPEVTEVTGGKKYLQEEAKRNIMLIPEMQPGSLNGKPKEIKYKVPFSF
ncbi:energy transducer TonB [Haloflavibacter putidus]|uniref:Energy transducer TonB n=1 Tax=Haloflavibacter putidus TaxID=2576776 RepID=A0A507ZVS6_9FLAO|nr:energy transducer TonB [Haloflavibacter putidus]TQD39798.1 energy transducer TonB [Haloflavibacter putidus]